MFLPGEAQGQGSLVGCRLWGRTESDTTEADKNRLQINDFTPQGTRKRKTKPKMSRRKKVTNLQMEIETRKIEKNKLRMDYLEKKAELMNL